MQHFFYRNLAGKRRPRRYVTAAGTIAALLAGLALITRVPPPPPPSLAVRRAPQSIGPAAAVEAAPPRTPAPVRCPEDPSEWRFTEVMPGDHYRRIEPTCAYAGLGRTAAWMLLVRLGYSKPEAAEALGFERLPWKPLSETEGFTNARGPVTLALQQEWPAHPDYRFWQVDRDGRPAVALSLRGCYAHAGAVHCAVALDRAPGSAVNVLGEHAFASHAAHLPGTRTLFLLRYQGADLWILLGQLDGPAIETTGLAQFAEERAQVTNRLGAAPWDAAWLSVEYGLEMRPLPDDWRLLGMAPEALEAITRELNQALGQEEGFQDE